MEESKDIEKEIRIKLRFVIENNIGIFWVNQEKQRQQEMTSKQKGSNQQELSDVSSEMVVVLKDFPKSALPEIIQHAPISESDNKCFVLTILKCTTLPPLEADYLVSVLECLKAKKPFKPLLKKTDSGKLLRFYLISVVFRVHFCFLSNVIAIPLSPFISFSYW